MGFLKKLKKALKKCERIVTDPLTRSARHKVDKQYQKSLEECHSAEREALLKLKTQFEEESQKIEANRKSLLETQKTNEKQFKEETEKLNQYLAAKEKSFEDTLEQIQNCFDSLRAAIYAAAQGKTEIFDIILPLLTKNAILKSHFLNLNLLHIAADNNQVGVLKQLSTVLDLNQKNDKGETAIDIAIKKGHVVATVVLVQRLLATVELFKAAQYGNIESMQALVAGGASLNTRYSRYFLEELVLHQRSYSAILWALEAGALSPVPTEGKPHPLPLAVTLANQHWDWRVRDLLAYELRAQEAPCKIDWATLDRSCGHLIKKALSPVSHSSETPCFNVINPWMKESALLFMVPGEEQILEYDAAQNKWSQLFFSREKSLSLEHKAFPLYQKIEQEWQLTHRQKLLKLTNFNHSDTKTKRLFLLTGNPDKGVRLWSYGYFGWTACKTGPDWKDFETMDISLVSGRGCIYLLGRQADKLELWSFEPNLEEWKKHPCPLRGIYSAPKLQLAVIKEKLFVFLARDEHRSAHPAVNARMELWCYEPDNRLWVLKPTSLWQMTPVGSRKIEMKKLKFSGEEQLFFFDRYDKGSALSQFNPIDGTWLIHSGGSEFPLSLDVEPKLRDVFRLQALYAPGLKSDVLFLIRFSNAGRLQCSIYSPLCHTWVKADVGFQPTEALQEAEIQLVLKDNAYKVLFLAGESLVYSISVPINIRALEQALRVSRPNSVPLLISTPALQKVQGFLEQISRSTHLLLESARTGNWLTVFSSLSNGADIEARDAQGFNALQLALQRSVDLETLKRLLQAGIACPKTTQLVSLTRDRNRVAVYNYLASLLERPALLTINLEEQFSKEYSLQIRRAEQFLEKQGCFIKKCQAVLHYYRLLTRSQPYAIYAWPALLLLSEILELPEPLLVTRKETLNNALCFFIEHYAVHKALAAVGVSNHKVALTLKHRDWTPIIHSLLLKDSAMTYSEQRDLEIHHPLVTNFVFTEHSELLHQGMTSALANLAEALELPPKQRDWLKAVAEWLVVNLQASPYALSEHFKSHYRQEPIVTASLAKIAHESDMLPTPPQTESNPQF